MGEGLAAETEDTTMTEGLACLNTGIIDEELHGKLSVPSMMKS